VEISTRELRSLVADVDDVHHEGLRTLPEEVAELHRLVGARRSFLKKAGLASALVTAGGLGFARRAAAQDDVPFDITAATFAAGVELAAVAAYQAAGGRGLLDEATLGLATTFAGHHQDHAGTFNGLLTSNGADAVTTPDQGLLDQFGPMITNAADAPALLEIAYTLEMAAAATYVAALGMLTIPDAALAVSQILPVEAQHALVLATALGKPIDEQLPAFETTDNSLLSN
jgi:hypothetical protein